MLCSSHVKLVMLTEHPDADVKEALGHVVLELRGKVSVGYVVLGLVCTAKKQMTQFSSWK